MADSTPTCSIDTPTYSRFQRTVTLYDWWLVHSQNHFHGNRLSISGVSSRKEEAVRVFNSAPIIKRNDECSLETADGIYVFIRGFINKQNTLKNGFTPQIFKSFLYGFPPNWESCALECFGEESEDGIDSANAVLDNVSTICQEMLFDGGENSIPTSLVLPEEALGNCRTPIPGDECKVAKEMSGVDVACGSGVNRCSARLLNIKVCPQKQQIASGVPHKLPDEEPSSSSKAVEKCDSDFIIHDITSENLPEITTNAVEKSFPTSLVSPDKGISDCKKLFLISNKMNEVNVVQGSGGNRRSARLHNVKVCQKNGGGLASPSTPIQSQSKSQVNTLSEQVINKCASRISNAFSPKTEGCYKKKRARVETRTAKPKRKMDKSASSMKSPQERGVSHLSKESKQRLSSVSPMSLSLKKSRSGRLLLPSLEFWRNQIPIYNADHEIKEIQEGSTFISPLRNSSPSLDSFRPINGQDMRHSVEVESTLSPQYKNGPGRPKMLRGREVDENSNPDEYKRCTKCDKRGHNSTGCKSTEVNSSTQPRKRKPKKTNQVPVVDTTQNAPDDHAPIPPVNIAPDAPIDAIAPVPPIKKKTENVASESNGSGHVEIKVAASVEFNVPVGGQLNENDDHEVVAAVVERECVPGMKPVYASQTTSQPAPSSLHTAQVSATKCAEPLICTAPESGKKRKYKKGVHKLNPKNVRRSDRIKTM